MNKKVIIISIIVIILVAVGAVVALNFIKQSTFDPTATPATPVKTVPDLSKSFGVCDLLDKDFVKTTLGVPALDLQGPDDLGRIYSEGGEESQQCVYGFAAGGTVENSFNSANGFTAEVYVFKDEAARDIAKPTTGADSGVDVVSGIGDEATFTQIETTIANADDPASAEDVTQYRLSAYVGVKRYTYTISVPRDSDDFTRTTAKAALTAIAKSVTY